MRLARLGMAFAAAVSLSASIVATPARADGNRPPIANDDPAVPGCNSNNGFGGAYPVAEDWIGDDASTKGWMPMFGSCGPLANDSDPDSDPLTVSLVGQPAHGQAMVISGPTVGTDWLLYKPDPDYSTLAGDQPGGAWYSDTIQYRAFDGQAYSNIANYRLWVAPVNDAPSFTPGASTVVAWLGEGPVSLPWATDIKAGPPNEAYQAVDFQTVNLDTTGVPNMFAVPPSIDASGSLTFTPGSEPGLAVVTVDLHDDGGLEDYDLGHTAIVPPADTSAPAQFQIAIEASQPGAPVAVDDSSFVYGDTPVCIPVLGNDSSPLGRPLSVTAVGTPAKGAAAVSTPDCGVLYTPSYGSSGPDSFTYAVSDDQGRGATAAVHLTLYPPPPDPPNAAPMANADSASVREAAASAPIDVLANDTDPDGDTLVITGVAPAAHGSVVIDGSVINYAPAAGYVGADSFDYTISDGHGHAATATASITVVPDNAPPTVGPLTMTLPAQTIGASTVKTLLSWTASDAAPGLKSTRLEMSANGGAFRQVTLAGPTATTAQLALVPGASYRFRTMATDGRDNPSTWRSLGPMVVKRVQESNGATAWRGTWSRVGDARLSGGTSRRTTSRGASATYTFYGRTIAWIATRGSHGGRAQVRIDGVLVGTVDTFTGSTSLRRTVFIRQLAARATHRLEIRALGDGFVDVDAFVVLP